MFLLLLSVNQAYRAAMQTQWSWILQLCHCVEQHLKENAVYFDVSYAASLAVQQIFMTCVSSCQTYSYDVTLLIVFQRCQRVIGLP